MKRSVIVLFSVNLYFSSCFFAQALELQYFFNCEKGTLSAPRTSSSPISLRSSVGVDLQRVVSGLTCDIETTFSVLVRCLEDKKADIKVFTHTGDQPPPGFQTEQEDVPWSACVNVQPDEPEGVDDYQCEYLSRTSQYVTQKKFVDFTAASFPKNVTFGDHQKGAPRGIRPGNYYIQYECTGNSYFNPTQMNVRLQHNPQLTRIYGPQRNITGGHTYPKVESCLLDMRSKDSIIAVDCKAYKNHQGVLSAQDLSTTALEYDKSCTNADASASANTCRDLKNRIDKNRPEFVLVCLGKNRGRTDDEKKQQKKLIDTACGICPQGEHMEKGHCVRTAASAPQDPSSSPSGCLRANGFWHAGPGWCEICPSTKVPGEKGCVNRAVTPPDISLPYCSPTFYYNTGDCRCNDDEDKSSGQYGDVICKKKTTPRDFTPPDTSEKKYPPGTICQKRGTNERGVIAADGVTCESTVTTQHCMSACDTQTQQCVAGRCVPKTPDTKTPPPAAPCEPQKQPCTTQQPPGSPRTGSPSSQQPSGPQGQRPQQGQNNPLSRLGKQLGQGLNPNQQQAQQQTDPSLMQRLMQMFQQKPFTTPFDNQIKEEIVCDSFEIDAPKTTGGLFRVKKGEPIEVSWSVIGGKRVTIDTTPRTSTKYDGNIGTATSATVTPSRTGVLTIRLKVDSNLYTKEPCRAKKIQVR